MFSKRTDYINWDQYFMGVAILSSYRSKDPNTPVGACIVKDNKILSMGYNGFPIGCSDDIFPWAREPIGDCKNTTKYPFVVHSELNAILNSSGKDLNGSTIYVTLFPCNECTKAIIQSGIKKIIYLDDKYSGTDSDIAAKKMLDCSNIIYEKYENKNRKISFEV